VIDAYYHNGPGYVLQRTFDFEFSGLLMSYPSWEEQLEDNAGSLCELAYGVDWDAWETRINKHNAYLWDKQEVKATVDYWNPNDVALNIPPGAVIRDWNLVGNRIEVVMDDPPPAPIEQRNPVRW
jgi:hypothetical protein